MREKVAQDTKSAVLTLRHHLSTPGRKARREIQGTITKQRTSQRALSHLPLLATLHYLEETEHAPDHRKRYYSSGPGPLIRMRSLLM